MRNSMNNPIKNTLDLGQSLWYDNIQRRLLQNGEMENLIASGEIRGMTSNPSIFNNAIAKSSDYDSALISYAKLGWDSERIFWSLAIEDILEALQLFTPLYHQSGGHDGFVSLEVNPSFANDTEATINQATYLWNKINKPNLMVKIPATLEGLPAIRKSISEGINVNVTLIFSIDRYVEVMRAFLDGIRDRLNLGKSVQNISSVASFFVSRLDTKIDALLTENSALQGKAAIANTKLAYLKFCEVFGSENFMELKEKGCQIQRPLWASTSTKNKNYPDTLYVDELIGPDTVNTVPPITLDAFRDHGTAKITITQGVEEARHLFKELEKEGILIDNVTKELEKEGVNSFRDAFTALIGAIDLKREEVVR